MSKAAFYKELFGNDELYLIDNIEINDETQKTEKTQKAEVVQELNTDNSPNVEESADIVEEAIVKEPEVAPLIEEFKIKGANKKNIIILVKEENEEFILQQDLEFLTKILSAVKLSSDDIGIINTSNNSIGSINRLKDVAKQLIVFNEQSDLFPAELYKVSEVSGFTTLKSHSLADVSADVEKKKQLWAALQTLFS